MARSQPVKEHRGRGIFRTQFSCCGKTFHGNRAQKAHHFASHSGLWASDKARKAGRRMGKEVDRMRRVGYGGLAAAGLRTPPGRGAPNGNLTARARSRPGK